MVHGIHETLSANVLNWLLVDMVARRELQQPADCAF